MISYCVCCCESWKQRNLELLSGDLGGIDVCGTIDLYVWPTKGMFNICSIY